MKKSKPTLSPLSCNRSKLHGEMHWRKGRSFASGATNGRTSVNRDDNGGHDAGGRGDEEEQMIKAFERVSIGDRKGAGGGQLKQHGKADGRRGHAVDKKSMQLHNITSDPKEINKVYKAAGIIPYCFIEREMHVLIGMEQRGGDKKFTWSEFGGKRDQIDNGYVDTAIREFSEETVGMYGEMSSESLQEEDTDMTAVYLSSCDMLRDHVKQLEKDGKEYALYVPEGKYLLLLLELPHLEPARFRAVMDANNRQNDPSRKVHDSEKVDVAWIPVQKVRDIIKRAHNQNTRGDAGVKVNRLERYPWRGSTNNGNGMEYLHPFFVQLFRKAEKLIKAIERNRRL